MNPLVSHYGFYSKQGAFPHEQAPLFMSLPQEGDMWQPACSQESYCFTSIPYELQLTH